MQIQRIRLSPAGESRTNAGYTLVELLVVLAVMALLIAAVPVTFSSARPGVEARSVAISLADLLREARHNAIMNDAEYKLVLDRANGNFAIVPGGKNQLIPRAVSIEIPGFARGAHEGPVEVRFYPDGSSSGGSIRVTGGAQSYLVVDHRLTGRITIDE